MKHRLVIRSLTNASLYYTDIVDRVRHVKIACEAFRLTINIRKTDAIGPNVVTPPLVNIGSVTPDVFDQFTYLGFTITNNMSPDTEIDMRILKAAAVMCKLSKRMWSNNS